MNHGVLSAVAASTPNRATPMTNDELGECVDTLLALTRVICGKCWGACVLPVGHGDFSVLCGMCEGRGWVLELEEDTEQTEQEGNTTYDLFGVHPEPDSP